MKYFPQEIETEQQLKTIFRGLSMKLHPDKGGDAQAFIEMKSEYEYLLKVVQFGIQEDTNLDLIDDLIQHQENLGYQKMWVYYTFIGSVREAKKSDFDYLAEKLGYKPGWAYYKWEEYKGEEI